MKQIIIISGGNPFNTYNDYISYLKNKPINIARFIMKDWKETLGQKLGGSFDVFIPPMPCKENAKYIEWQIWFEKLLPFFNDEIILIGHSLGGIFLAKWLSENKCPKKINAVFLVASPFILTGQGQENTDFVLQNNLNLFNDQVNEIRLYHSEDDHIVEFSQVKKYIELLPKSKHTFFKERKHFNGADFPEIVSDIESLQK